jgi:hypothetical protein
MSQPSDQLLECGPWDHALKELKQWDPSWAAACKKMTMNPWTNGVLPRKFVELVGVALNAACTNLNPDAPYSSGTRCRCDAGRDSHDPQNGVSDVDPRLQPGRTHLA